LALLAEAYGLSGEPDKGIRTLSEALEIVRSSRAFFYEAELYRLEGALLWGADSGENLDEVEDKFRKALDVSRRQKAKSLELRAGLSLARLWGRQGRREEAHQLLSGVYTGFSEGFDTKDLMEAKDLLGEYETGD
jgi:predicted ATPase